MDISCQAATLQEQPTSITEYNEPLVRQLIEKVTINEDKFTVRYDRCGSITRHFTGKFPQVRAFPSDSLFSQPPG
jgi:site-specific DNA recombinase